MIVTRHIGQLGNSMFQIAAAIGYARKYNYEWAADYGRGVSDPYSKIHDCFPNLPKHELHGHRFHEHPNQFCPIHNVHLNECHFDYHPIPNLGPNVTMTGFFQSWKYFEGQDEEIKKVFALPHVTGYEDYVSVHIRRGDYVQHSGSFPPITVDYVEKAMMKIKKANYLVFSDDINWCKESFAHLNNSIQRFEYSEGRSTFEDLTLMASCGHHIIANSTFSWWASYLGHNPDRITVCPSASTWFGPTAGVKKPVVDLIPPHWIQIPTR